MKKEIDVLDFDNGHFDDFNTSDLDFNKVESITFLGNVRFYGYT